MDRIARAQERIVDLVTREFGLAVSHRAIRNTVGLSLFHLPAQPSVEHVRRHVSTASVMRDLNEVGRLQDTEDCRIVCCLVQTLWPYVSSQKDALTVEHAELHDTRFVRG